MVKSWHVRLLFPLGSLVVTTCKQWVTRPSPLPRKVSNILIVFLLGKFSISQYWPKTTCIGLQWHELLASVTHVSEFVPNTFPENRASCYQVKMGSLLSPQKWRTCVPAFHIEATKRMQEVQLVRDRVSGSPEKGASRRKELPAFKVNFFAPLSYLSQFPGLLSSPTCQAHPRSLWSTDPNLSPRMGNHCAGCRSKCSLQGGAVGICPRLPWLPDGSCSPSNLPKERTSAMASQHIPVFSFPWERNFIVIFSATH